MLFGLLNVASSTPDEGVESVPTEMVSSDPLLMNPDRGLKVLTTSKVSFAPVEIPRVERVAPDPLLASLSIGATELATLK